MIVCEVIGDIVGYERNDTNIDSYKVKIRKVPSQELDETRL